MIVHLSDLTVRIVELSHAGLVERRLELVPVHGGDPLITLSIDEGMALAGLIRRRVREAIR